MLDLDLTMRALPMVALVLYLAPAVQRFRIPAKPGLWMRRGAVTIIVAAICVSLVATVRWLMKG